MAPAGSIKPYDRPAASPLRKEILHLLLVRKSGAPVDCMAIINRNGDSMSLGETVMSRQGSAFEFAPFYRAWGRPVPASWIKMNAAVMAQAKKE
jgi:hypothetical protein